MDVIELPPQRGLAAGILVFGLALLGVGAVTMGNMPLPGSLFLLGWGGLVSFGCLRTLFGPPVRFRANADGLWFGRGSVIPWRDVKAIFESKMDVKVYGSNVKVGSIAIQFERSRTLFRAPMGYWFVTWLAVGDIDLSVHTDTGYRASVLASKLEAMRERARTAPAA